MKVVHLAMTHRLDDARIFIKECNTLANNGYEVIFITGQREKKVRQRIGNVIVETVEILPGCSPIKHPFKWLLNRRKNFSILLKTALKYNADTYHIHEYDLIHLIKRIKKFSNPYIIYDVHEDSPREFLEKYYNKGFLKYSISKFISKFIEKKEIRVSRKVDSIIAATPYLGKRFSQFHDSVTVICNYAIVEKIVSNVIRKNNWICYVGSIAPIRGITQIVDAISGTSIRLQLAGDLPESYHNELKKRPGWVNVDYRGVLSREEVRQVYASSSIGILTLLNGGNIENSLPVKLFEYMEAGLPVIASDYPYWQEIIKNAHCGVCIDPYDVNELSIHIQKMLLDVNKRDEMGRNGRKEMEVLYNWQYEAEKLLVIYRNIKIVDKAV